MIWLVVIFLIVMILSLRHGWPAPLRGCCPGCGYNLTGNVSGICPECGKAIESPIETTP